MPLADMGQVYLGEVQHGWVAEGQFKSEGSQVDLIICWFEPVAEDMVQMKGHLKVRRTARPHNTFTLITDVLAASKLGFLGDSYDEVNGLALFLSRADHKQ